MRVKAKTSFVGLISMGVGEVRDIPNSDALTDLIRCGYVEAVEAEAREAKNESKRAKSKPNR